MPHNELFVLMGIGGLFILLGLGVLFIGRSEEKSYYDSISSRQDAREFLEGWPKRPEFGSLQIGGWIAFAIGLLMLIASVIFILV